jgi:hypothetical protein
MAKKIRPWDPAVIVFVVVCLFIGWFIKATVEGRETTFSDEEYGVTLKYPRGWFNLAQEGTVLSVSNPQCASTFKTKFTFGVQSWGQEVGVSNFITDLSVKRGDSLSLFRIITRNPVELGGSKATKLEYAYAIDPVRLRAGAVSIPIVVRAFDIIVPKGNKMYVFTFAADEKEYEKNLSKFLSIADSIRIQ